MTTGSSATVIPSLAGMVPTRWATAYLRLTWGLVGRRSSSPPVATTRARILDDGGVKCWGRNDYGQLGYGDTQHRGDGAGEMGDNLEAIYFRRYRRRLLPPGSTITCALLYDGSVKCWGEQ